MLSDCVKANISKFKLKCTYTLNYTFSPVKTSPPEEEETKENGDVKENGDLKENGTAKVKSESVKSAAIRESSITQILRLLSYCKYNGRYFLFGSVTLIIYASVRILIPYFTGRHRAS
jgi:hypothetical protein